MKSKKCLFVTLASLLTLLTACGGGGGGDDTANYAGVWDVRALKASDSCNSGVSPNGIRSTVRVNQDGTRIVLNSGDHVATGTTNDEDGFDVVSDVLPLERGCTGAFAYSFSEASDGNAAVGIGLAVTCQGQTCTLGFGGTATRTSDRTLETDGDDPTTKAFSEIVTRQDSFTELDQQVADDALAASAADEAK